jgi:pyruvate formate lyase activating enzyme
VQALDALAPYLDAANVDLKAFRDETYRTYCGARIAPVKRNIRHLVEAGIWTEVTTLVIPGLNDSDGELGDIAAFLAATSPDIPWHVSAFTPHYHMHDRPPTPASTLRRAWAIGKAAGLRHIYLGNVWGDRSLEGCTDTCCPTCGGLVIRRRGYHTATLWREPGVCPRCGGRVAGIWT